MERAFSPRKKIASDFLFSLKRQPSPPSRLSCNVRSTRCTLMRDQSREGVPKSEVRQAVVWPVSVPKGQLSRGSSQFCRPKRWAWGELTGRGDSLGVGCGVGVGWGGDQKSRVSGSKDSVQRYRWPGGEAGERFGTGCVCDQLWASCRRLLARPVQPAAQLSLNHGGTSEMGARTQCGV